MTERRRAESLSDQVSALEAQMAILNESRLSSLAAQEQVSVSLPTPIAFVKKKGLNLIGFRGIF